MGELVIVERRGGDLLGLGMAGEVWGKSGKGVAT